MTKIIMFMMKIYDIDIDNIDVDDDNNNIDNDDYGYLTKKDHLHFGNNTTP